MNDDLDLPTYAPIPADVRDRLRRRVQTQIRHPKSRLRVPLTVAAAVALLAVAAVIVVNNRSTTNEPAAPPRTDRTIQRCMAAVEQAGKVADFPDRATWRVPLVYAPGYNDLTVLGITAGDSRFFCETTELTVTISDPLAQPRYAEGSKTALLSLSANGVLAGVIDPSWPAARIALPHGAQSVQRAVAGMFVYNTENTLSDSDVFTVEKATADVHPNFPATPPTTVLPHPPVAALSVHDVPVPVPDRTSAHGQALAACISQANQLVLDPANYEPGALVRKDQSVLVIGRSPTRIAACMSMPVPELGQTLTTFAVGPRLSDVEGDQMAFYPGPVNLSGGARSTLAGLVPKDTAKMEVRFGNGTTVSPDVANGTFALIIPDSVEVDGSNEINDEKGITVKLFGPQGGMFHEGPLTVWHPN
jgi:hypothetical protein